MSIVGSTKTFRSGNSEAVRLPKEIAFGPDVELVVERKGDVVTMYPKRTSGRELVEKLNALPRPSTVQKRAPFVAPRRQGL